MKTPAIIKAIAAADPEQTELRLGPLTVRRFTPAPMYDSRPPATWQAVAEAAKRNAACQARQSRISGRQYCEEPLDDPHSRESAALDAVRLYGSEKSAVATIRRQLAECPDLDPAVAKRAARLAAWLEQPFRAVRETRKASAWVPRKDGRGTKRVVTYIPTEPERWVITGPRIAHLVAQIGESPSWMRKTSLTVSADQLSKLSLTYNIETP